MTEEGECGVDGDCYDNEIACGFTGAGFASLGNDIWLDGDGSPHARGQRVGMDSCLRLCGGGVRGWVPACARTTRRGWILACVFMGVGPVRGGTGMGPRMREDNGRGMDSCLRLHGGGALCGGGTGMGPRMREDNGEGMDSSLRLATMRGGTGVGRVGMDSVRGGTGMGPRMREDNGWGWK